MGLCGSVGEVTSCLGGRSASLHCSQIMNNVKSSTSSCAVVPNGLHRTLSSPARPQLAPASRAARTAQNHMWSAEALNRQPCCHHTSARAIFRQPLAKGPGASSISAASAGTFNRQGGKINNATATILSYPARIWARPTASPCRGRKVPEGVRPGRLLELCMT